MGNMHFALQHVSAFVVECLPNEGLGNYVAPASSKYGRLQAWISIVSPNLGPSISIKC
jgi:hypothetical protein